MGLLQYLVEHHNKKKMKTDTINESNSSTEYYDRLSARNALDKTKNTTTTTPPPVIFLSIASHKLHRGPVKANIYYFILYIFFLPVFPIKDTAADPR